MRMVVVHLSHEALEPIRTELLGLPLRSLSVSEVSCPEPNGITLRYRGATLTQQSRSEVKLECIVGRDDVAGIVDTVHRYSRAHALGQRTVYVMALEEADRAPADASSVAWASGSAAQRIALSPHESTRDADLVAAG